MYMVADGDLRVLFALLLMPAVCRQTYIDLPDLKCCITELNLNQSTFLKKDKWDDTVKDCHVFKLPSIR